MRKTIHIRAKMNLKKQLKLTLLFTIVFGFTSCLQETKSKVKKSTTPYDTTQDTIIVKQKHKLNKAFEKDFLSKSYSYYWLVGKDTLDFVVRAREYAKDSALHLSIHHKNPMLFSTTLKKIDECFPIINQDLHLSKLNSFYFGEPINYSDLATELSSDYERQFGRKSINYQKLNTFLLNSKLNRNLENLVGPFEKEVKRYSIEKFHLMEKKYYKSYFPNIDLTKYPEFTLHGMGLHIHLENKKK